MFSLPPGPLALYSFLCAWWPLSGRAFDANPIWLPNKAITINPTTVRRLITTTTTMSSSTPDAAAPTERKETRPTQKMNRLPTLEALARRFVHDNAVSIIAVARAATVLTTRCLSVILGSYLALLLRQIASRVQYRKHPHQTQECRALVSQHPSYIDLKGVLSHHWRLNLPHQRVQLRRQFNVQSPT